MIKQRTNYLLLMLALGPLAWAGQAESSSSQTRLFVIAHHTYNSGNEPPPENTVPGGYGYYIAPVSDPQVGLPEKVFISHIY